MVDYAKTPGLDYIQAPKLVAVALNAFLKKLITHARALKPLPARMVTRVTQLEAAQADLAAALGLKHGEDLSADPARVEADRAVDDAVRAYYELTSALARVGPPTGEVAAKAKANFFPKDDITFLNLDFEQEWSEIDTRITNAEQQGHFEAVSEIGGKVVVQNLKKRHKEYGKALGITAASSRAVATTLEGPYGIAQNALRRYMAGAIALGAESDVDPEVIPQAEHLLAPIEDARARAAIRRGKSGKGGDEGITPSDGTDNEPTPVPDNND